jgi:isoleucyl-tRNA synthetase
MTDKRDYRDTVFLPKTDFPMKAGLPQKEPGILARWQEEDIYGQVRAARAGRETFILHDGPPYANGDMHIGHALNHILKDMVVRTQTLLGKDAPYVPGWDCHGLPIEWKVEEEYRKKKKNKDEVPPKEFRAECRAYAQKWVDVQREQLKRLGINAAWDRPYLTMDFQAEATIVGELLKFAESGQLYRGAKPVMWSPVEKTALAEAEVEYEDIVSTQIDVAFEITDSPIAALKGAYAVIWTTTPWTIPVNQALAYGPEVEYVVVWRQALNCSPPALAEAMRRWGYNETAVAARGKGAELAGTVARHPMHALGGFFAEPRPLLAGDFVTTDSGTGLVHMAPDHGEDDFALCKAHGIEPKFAVTADGKYREDWGWLGGQGSVINPKFNAPDGPICSALAEVGALMAASADYKHSYPHSWRSKAKVIYRCTPSGSCRWTRPAKAAPARKGRRGDRRHALRARKGPQPHRRHGRRAARLGALAPARLGRADHPVRQPPDRAVSGRSRSQRPHHRRRDGRRAWTPGTTSARRTTLATTTSRGLRARHRHSRRVVRSGSTHAFVLDRAAGPNCAGRPISISKAATSIAAGSSPRCWKAAPRAAVRLMTRS